RCLFLADAGQRRTRPATPRFRRLDGGRPSRAGRDGEARRTAGFFCRRPLYYCGYSALRLHARRASVRLRPRALSGVARLARANRRATGSRADGFRSGKGGRRQIALRLGRAGPAAAALAPAAVSWKSADTCLPNVLAIPHIDYVVRDSTGV